MDGFCGELRPKRITCRARLRPNVLQRRPLLLSPHNMPMAQKIDIEASKSEDHNKLAVKALKDRLEKIHLGGGEERIADHKASDGSTFGHH